MKQEDKMRSIEAMYYTGPFGSLEAYEAYVARLKVRADNLMSQCVEAHKSTRQIIEEPK